MNTQQKLDLIAHNLEEVIDQEQIEQILKERELKVYWGTAPTGKPHLGYFMPMFKIADLLKAGCEVTILFANMHAYLDNMKSNWEVLEHRTNFYKFLIPLILKQVGAPIEKLKFVTGTDYQLTPEYTLDMYKVASLTTLQSVKGAGAEVVKQVENPLLSGMLYPILQALDEQYLNADVQMGGTDQRKIFMFARETLPKIGYKKRSYILHSLVPGLGKSGKMSSSEPNSKIDLDDSDEVIKAKISGAFSTDKIVEGNGILAMCKFVLFQHLQANQESLIVSRPEKWGGNIEFKTYQELESAFVSGQLSSIDLKPAVSDVLIRLISPIRQELANQTDLINLAYPK